MRTDTFTGFRQLLPHRIGTEERTPLVDANRGPVIPSAFSFIACPFLLFLVPLLLMAARRAPALEFGRKDTERRQRVLLLETDEIFGYSCLCR